MQYRVMARYEHFNKGTPWCTSGWCDSFIHALWCKQRVQHPTHYYFTADQNLWIEDEHGRKVNIDTFQGQQPLKYCVRKAPHDEDVSAVSGWFDTPEDAEVMMQRLYRKNPKQLFWVSMM